MADQTRYQESGIGLAPQPITPSVDNVGSRARASMAGNVSDLLDRMASSLYKTATEEAQRQGLQWGAQNSVTVDQLQAAVAAGDDPLANRHTTFGEAARKVQATILSNTLNAQGVGEMSRIQAEAEIGKIPLSVAAEKMDAISAAFSNNLAKVDPETGIKLRAALTSHSASVYNHLAQQEVKKFQAAQKASIDDYFAKLPKTLETIFLGGDIVGPDGVTKTANDLAQVQRAQAVQAARITGDAAYGTKFDKALSEAKIGSLTRLFSDTQFGYASNPATALDQIEQKDMAGIPAPYRTTWALMTEEEKSKVKEHVVKAFAQRYDVVKKTSDAEKLQSEKESHALELEFYSPGTTAARKAEILPRLRALNVVSPEMYHKMIKGDDESMTKNREAEVADMIDTGAITTFQQLKGVASGAALVRLQRNLRTEGNQTERQAEGVLLEAVAGTKSPVSALNNEQQAEKYNLQNRYRNEIDQAKAEGKPFSYRDIAIRVADEYKAKKFNVKMKEDRDALGRIEADISKALSRTVSISSMSDINDLDKAGAWKGKESSKRRAISAINAINQPVLIPEAAQK